MTAPSRHVPVAVRWVMNRGVGGGRSGGGCGRSGKGGLALENGAVGCSEGGDGKGGS